MDKLSIEIRKKNAGAGVAQKPHMEAMASQLGSFIGVWLGGKIQSITGSYDLVWWMAIALSLVAAALCLPVREKPIAIKLPGMTSPQAT